MKKVYSMFFAAAVSGAVLTSCADSNEIVSDRDMPTDREAAAMLKAGFDTDNFTRIDDGFLVEGDIFFRTVEDLENLGEANVFAEQYSTNNLVATGGSRVITIYAPEEGSGGRGKKGGSGYSAAMIAGLDEAISRYNAQNLEISFQRVTSSSGADIVMTRLSKRDESRGVLGSAGFPTASGDPYGEIKMSGVLESNYGLSTNGIATIIAHEMGHCVGFRHTDFFDRSISCGGSTANEGDGGVGANHIPGTATGADLAGAGSWMLACTDGGNRPFTNDDRTALDYLY